MTAPSTQIRARIGEVRPSQLLYTYGIGSIVDLQYMSAIVLGLDDWDDRRTGSIEEPRLLTAVRAQLGNQVTELRTPPVPLEIEALGQQAEQHIGVPVAAFPRYMLCPYCRILAPISSGIFRPKISPYHEERAAYVHEGCPRQKFTVRPVIPARFLIACKSGHVDDFPWVEFVHKGSTCPGNPSLRLDELGATGEAADVQVKCQTCGLTRRMSDAFGTGERSPGLTCSGRAPHLRMHDDACGEEARPILLGASNIWFPRVISVLSIPETGDRITQLVDDQWAVLQTVTSLEVLRAFRIAMRAQLADLAGFTDEQVWEAIQLKQGGGRIQDDQVPLKVPEWRAFTQPESTPSSPDFLLTRTDVHPDYRDRIASVVLVERLREVRAFMGFNRLESQNDFGDAQPDSADDRLAPISRKPPTWVPTNDVRGEGIFIQFREEAIAAWEAKLNHTDYAEAWQKARQGWWSSRGNDTAANQWDDGLMRQMMIHSFSHLLMRQLALDCGYATAGLKERIYSRPATDEYGAMAGVLIYTAASDSEGTLGGLVSQGSSDKLGPAIAAALEQAMICASDPLCAEHEPDAEGSEVHGAACHACLFAPETSCETGNRWLDRSLVVPTFTQQDAAFFGR